MLSLIIKSTVIVSMMFGLIHADVPTDEITDLPGLSWKPSFRQYSGYLSASGTRKLHYWFVESQNNPKTDPVVLWMNGGPGCSSLDGFLSEHGPFQIKDDGRTLSKNPYSWNMVANVLYLEAPAGVGFSYADDKNYTTNDDQTSFDNHAALTSFFKLYSEYSSNDFYITGESYGGIYVPTLSILVASDSSIQLKGFAVGNGLSDYQMNSDSAVYYMYYHGIIGTKIWLPIVAACCKNGNSTLGNCNFDPTSSTDCQTALSAADEEMNGINPYNVYADCYQSSQQNKLQRGRQDSMPHPPLFLFRNPSALNKISKNITLSVPCVNATAVTNYLNDASVRKALHIPTALPDWTICSGIPYTRQYVSMKNQYLVLLAKKLRVLIYNGDFDLMCNYLGDEWFVESLQQDELHKWQSWNYKGSYGSMQVGGYMKRYQNLVFATVKGAGHMVPSDKPMQALELLKRFLSNSY